MDGNNGTASFARWAGEDTCPYVSRLIAGLEALRHRNRAYLLCQR